MLFNSYEFLFGFFPCVIIFFYVFSRFSGTYGVVFLILASLFFYAWWNYLFLSLLLSSILFNYFAARVIAAAVEGKREHRATLLLAAAVTANLATLGVFKYGRFFTENVNSVFGTDYSFISLVLPLGISFFTFEQIAYLVDVRRNRRLTVDLLRYTLFVSFFPRLVAGPILRYYEVIPQFPDRKPVKLSWDNLAVGLTLFIIGLAKKAILADGIAQYVTPVFATAGRGEAVDFFMAWGGVLAYTLQLYFDFSGYSDMAIGAARCFGLRFPQNFNSPYKATSIIEFWRRWHITLSRFLRDYLYISLGGNRHGRLRRHVNLMITMLLGGLWHGANWTFVFWGGLHGLYLVVNHGWHAIAGRFHWSDRLARSRSAAVFGWLLTFGAVVIGWVFFRAPTFRAAVILLQGMIGGHGIGIPNGLAFAFGSHRPLLERLGVTFLDTSGTTLISTYAWVLALLGIALLLPNSQELLARWQPVLESPATAIAAAGGRWRLQWMPSRGWAVGVALLGVLGAMSITRVSEFLYWQF